MKLRLSNGRPASQSDITELEESLGESLPTDFVDFLRYNDGSQPDTNIFQVGKTKNESGVNGFIPVREIAGERIRIERLSKTAFPIAWAEGGNYIVIDLAQEGAVFFWDHEQPTEVVLLADSFASFLSLLEPFEVNTIKLKP